MRHAYKPHSQNKSEIVLGIIFKGKWQQFFLSSHLKETLKLHIEFYYIIFIFTLFRDIF